MRLSFIRQRKGVMLSIVGLIALSILVTLITVGHWVTSVTSSTPVSFMPPQITDQASPLDYSTTKHIQHHDSQQPSTGGVDTTLLLSSDLLPPIGEQLRRYEATLPQDLVKNFQFQSIEVPRSRSVDGSIRHSNTHHHNNGTLAHSGAVVGVGAQNEARMRPHMMSYDASLRQFPLPVPTSCPSSIRPDCFCVPNLGRDWKPQDVVFPISYSLPEELFVKEIPAKTKDCADIVPRVRGTYRFTSEAEYVAEYSRSFYCLTFKKGGWDVLRHYEIIAAGCMPYLVDIEHTPVYVLYHLPKQLLLEARDLPGVHFNCSGVRVVIDHRVFPRERYFTLLGQLLAHARSYLTTTAMAKYVLNVSGKPSAKKVLYLAAGNKKAPLRAQGNYNSWTLFHGLRGLLGAGAVDPFKIPFLYRQPPEVVATMKKSLYGLGFGYAFRLEDLNDVDRENILQKITDRHYDLIIFADPTSLVSSSSKQIKLLKHVQKTYSKQEIIWLHAPDIAYPMPQTQGYAPSQLYETGVVLQREIMDCSYYAPPIEDRKAEAMKRCVWYLNKNCFDDVNVQMVKKEKQLSKYVWSIPEVPALRA